VVFTTALALGGSIGPGEVAATQGTIRSFSAEVVEQRCCGLQVSQPGVGRKLRPISAEANKWDNLGGCYENHV
jgi:hypothetical protein